MSKFAYHGGAERDWEGLSRHALFGKLIVSAKCEECPAEKTVALSDPLPPDQIANQFKRAGWGLGRHLLCPECRKCERKKPVTKPAEREPVQPTDAARTQRRMIFMALEGAYDEGGKRYRVGHTDDSIATEVGCHANAVRIVREEFFGPAAPPEPPEIASLRTDLAAALETASGCQREIDKITTQASALVGHINVLTDRLDRFAKGKGWQ